MYLREDLIAAGCKREALHVPQGDAMRARMKFHNLRDTCHTHMAVRRDPPQDVQWRAGHTTSAMTERYITNARYEAGASFGEPLPRLPESVLGLRDQSTEGLSVENDGGGAGNRTRVRKFRCHLRLRAYSAF